MVLFEFEHIKDQSDTLFGWNQGTWVMECVTRQRMFVFYSGSEPWDQRAEWPLGQVKGLGF
jgi:hypothetical protein